MESSVYAARLAEASAASELAFSERTYRGRLAAVRQAMADGDLDTLLVTHSCDLNYLTGYDTFGVDIYAALIVTGDGDPVLHTMTVEVRTVEVRRRSTPPGSTIWCSPSGINRKAPVNSLSR